MYTAELWWWQEYGGRDGVVEDNRICVHPPGNELVIRSKASNLQSYINHRRRLSFFLTSSFSMIDSK